MSDFTTELHDIVHDAEEKIEDFLGRFEHAASDEEKAVLADAKADATTLHEQIDAEAPKVEEDATEALKNAVDDLSSKVTDVVENPSHLESDLSESEHEFENQERPAEQQLEHDAEADARQDEATAEQQGQNLEQLGRDDLEHPASDGDTTDRDATLNANEPTAAPAEPDAVVEDDPEEGTEAANVKATIDAIQKQIDESNASVPEPASDAETAETFANRIPDHRGSVAGSTHQV